MQLTDSITRIQAQRSVGRQPPMWSEALSTYLVILMYNIFGRKHQKADTLKELFIVKLMTAVIENTCVPYWISTPWFCQNPERLIRRGWITHVTGCIWGAYQLTSSLQSLKIKQTKYQNPPQPQTHHHPLYHHYHHHPAPSCISPPWLNTLVVVLIEYHRPAMVKGVNSSTPHSHSTDALQVWYILRVVDGIKLSSYAATNTI